MTRGRVPLCPERVPCIVGFRVSPGERLGSDRARACRYCVHHTHDDAMTGSRPERSALYIQSALRNDAMTGFLFLPRAERFTLLCSPGRSALQQSALQFHNHSAAPMGHGVWPRQPTWAVSTTLVRQHRGNANRGETYPPAVHADARHCAEPTATAPATRRSLSRFVRSSLV